MPIFGGEIQEANSPAFVTGFISEAMKSPSSTDGSQPAFFEFRLRVERLCRSAFQIEPREKTAIAGPYFCRTKFTISIWR